MITKRRPVLPLLLCLAIIVILGLVFRSFVMDNIVRPITLVAWAVWRILTSVNQQVYWGMVIAISLFLAIQLIPPESPNIHALPENDRPTIGNEYSTWFSIFESAMSDSNSLEELKRRLMNLYISSVAQRDKVTPTDEDMLRSRRLPLSEGSQLFFSPHKGTLRARFYEQKLRFIIKMTGSRMLRGNKMPALIHEPIDELLNLMEDQTEDDHER